MFSHPNPEHVVLIGGGDGAVLCEVLKHKSVKTVTICEIDEKVIEVSKRYFPEYADVWKHPKLMKFVGDGCAFLGRKENRKRFDVIIVDSSDPVGPAEALFEQKFFQSCKKALRRDGILCTQGECQWLHVNIIEEVTKFCGGMFDKVQYGYTTIPTYPSGQIGFIICSKGDYSLKKPHKSVKKALKKKDRHSLRYYNKKVHKAAFIIPEFAKSKIQTK